MFCIETPEIRHFADLTKEAPTTGVGLGDSEESASVRAG
jgi:hypothetical protein